MKDFQFKSFGVKAKVILMNCTFLCFIRSGGLPARKTGQAIRPPPVMGSISTCPDESLPDERQAGVRTG